MTLSTIHRVKGMEWEKVVVFGVTAGVLPHRLATDDEEERRVLHVALTRCRRQVVIMTDEARPSPYLAELLTARIGDAPDGPASWATSRRAAGSGRQLLAEGVGSAGAVGASPRAARRGRAGGAPKPVAGVDPLREQALRAWRTERSRRDKIPPFIVMHDRTLLAVAAAKPASLVALRQVEGIGPAKLELYGEEILATLAAIPG